ncbi:MAG: hypothetical protein P4L22_04210 [Candidatus Babeliales bacterium]|nr:hypothetical protein [Candidatus Babeliales bacterium]
MKIMFINYVFKRNHKFLRKSLVILSLLIFNNSFAITLTPQSKKTVKKVVAPTKVTKKPVPKKKPKLIQKVVVKKRPITTIKPKKPLTETKIQNFKNSFCKQLQTQVNQCKKSTTPTCLQAQQSLQLCTPAKATPTLSPGTSGQTSTTTIIMQGGNNGDSSGSGSTDFWHDSFNEFILEMVAGLVLGVAGIFIGAFQVYKYYQDKNAAKLSESKSQADQAKADKLKQVAEQAQQDAEKNPTNSQKQIEAATATQEANAAQVEANKSTVQASKDVARVNSGNAASLEQATTKIKNAAPGSPEAALKNKLPELETATKQAKNNATVSNQNLQDTVNQVNKENQTIDPAVDLPPGSPAPEVASIVPDAPAMTIDVPTAPPLAPDAPTIRSNEISPGGPKKGATGVTLEEINSVKLKPAQPLELVPQKGLDMNAVKDAAKARADRVAKGEAKKTELKKAVEPELNQHEKLQAELKAKFKTRAAAQEKAAQEKAAKEKAAQEKNAVPEEELKIDLSNVDIATPTDLSNLSDLGGSTEGATSNVGPEGFDFEQWQQENGVSGKTGSLAGEVSVADAQAAQTAQAENQAKLTETIKNNAANSGNGSTSEEEEAEQEAREREI